MERTCRRAGCGPWRSRSPRLRSSRSRTASRSRPPIPRLPANSDRRALRPASHAHRFSASPRRSSCRPRRRSLGIPGDRSVSPMTLLRTIDHVRVGQDRAFGPDDESRALRPAWARFARAPSACQRTGRTDCRRRYRVAQNGRPRAWHPSPLQQRDYARIVLTVIWRLLTCYVGCSVGACWLRQPCGIIKSV